MPVNARTFMQLDLHTHEWFIMAGKPITEIHFSEDVKRAAVAALQKDVTLDPKNFEICDPGPKERIADHVCFRYTNPQGNVTLIYVHQDHIDVKGKSWVDDNRFI